MTAPECCSGCGWLQPSMGTLQPDTGSLWPSKGTFQPGVGHQALGTSTGTLLEELQEGNGGRRASSGGREVNKLPKPK